MNLNNLNLVELNAQEVQEVDGGEDKYGYYSLYWSGTDNELQYAGEAVWNLGVMAVNGSAWIANQF
jgi:hypothetical protein